VENFVEVYHNCQFKLSLLIPTRWGLHTNVLEEVDVELEIEGETLRFFFAAAVAAAVTVIVIITMSCSIITSTEYPM